MRFTSLGSRLERKSAKFCTSRKLLMIKEKKNLNTKSVHITAKEDFYPQYGFT